VTGKFSARQLISGSTRHDADTVSTASLNTRPLLLFYSRYVLFTRTLNRAPITDCGDDKTWEEVCLVKFGKRFAQRHQDPKWLRINMETTSSEAWRVLAFWWMKRMCGATTSRLFYIFIAAAAVTVVHSCIFALRQAGWQPASTLSKNDTCFLSTPFENIPNINNLSNQTGYSTPTKYLYEQGHYRIHLPWTWCILGSRRITSCQVSLSLILLKLASFGSFRHVDHILLVYDELGVKYNWIFQ